MRKMGKLASIATMVSLVVGIAVPTYGVPEINAAADFLYVSEDSVPVGFYLVENDSGHGLKTIVAVTQPRHGLVTIDEGSHVAVIYTPDADFAGTDTFTYTLDDEVAQMIGTVTVEVLGSNDPPVGNADLVKTYLNTKVVLNPLVNDTDVDGDNLLLNSWITNPTHGSLSSSRSKIYYTPALGWCGSDSFTYELSDPSNVTDTAVQTVEVACTLPPQTYSFPSKLKAKKRYRLASKTKQGTEVSVRAVGKCKVLPIKSKKKSKIVIAGKTIRKKAIRYWSLRKVSKGSCRLTVVAAATTKNSKLYKVAKYKVGRR